MTDLDHENSTPLEGVSWPLRTDRLSIRGATAEDEASMRVHRRLDDVSRWGSWGPVDEEDWRALLAPRLRDVLVVELDGRIVGDFVVKVVAGWAQREARDQARGVQGELSWALDPSVGGRGYATEALHEVLRMCFEDLHVRRVVANAFAADEASCRRRNGWGWAGCSTPRPSSCTATWAGSTESGTPCWSRSGRRLAEHRRQGYRPVSCVADPRGRCV